MSTIDGLKDNMYFPFVSPQPPGVSVQRMSGFDAQFIYDERPDEPQHTLKISFLSGVASEAWSFASARSDLARRLAALEPLQWKALRVPFDLHHPVWVADPELDLDW